MTAGTGTVVNTPDGFATQPLEPLRHYVRWDCEHDNREHCEHDNREPLDYEPEFLYHLTDSPADSFFIGARVTAVPTNEVGTVMGVEHRGTSTVWISVHFDGTPTSWIRRFRPDQLRARWADSQSTEAPSGLSGTMKPASTAAVEVAKAAVGDRVMWGSTDRPHGEITGTITRIDLTRTAPYHVCWDGNSGGVGRSWYRFHDFRVVPPAAKFKVGDRVSSSDRGSPRYQQLGTVELVRDPPPAIMRYRVRWDNHGMGLSCWYADTELELVTPPAEPQWTKGAHVCAKGNNGGGPIGTLLLTPPPDPVWVPVLWRDGIRGTYLKRDIVLVEEGTQYRAGDIVRGWAADGTLTDRYGVIAKVIADSADTLIHVVWDDRVDFPLDQQVIVYSLARGQDRMSFVLCDRPGGRVTEQQREAEQSRIDAITDLSNKIQPLLKDVALHTDRRLIVAIDESGSMKGDRLIWAKAFTDALMAKRRDVGNVRGAVIAYGDEPLVWRNIYGVGGATGRRLWLKHNFGGGTDTARALTKVLEECEIVQGSVNDVIMITDEFYSGVDNSIIFSKWQEARARLKFRAYLVSLHPWVGQDASAWFDEVFTLPVQDQTAATAVGIVRRLFEPATTINKAQEVGVFHKGQRVVHRKASQTRVWGVGTVTTVNVLGVSVRWANKPMDPTVYDPKDLAVAAVQRFLVGERVAAWDDGCGCSKRRGTVANIGECAVSVSWDDGQVTNHVIEEGSMSGLLLVTDPCQ